MPFTIILAYLLFTIQKKKIGKQIETQNILDIAPTILDIFGIEIPKDMEGKIIKF